MEVTPCGAAPKTCFQACDGDSAAPKTSHMPGLCALSDMAVVVVVAAAAAERTSMFAVACLGCFELCCLPSVCGFQ